MKRLLLAAASSAVMAAAQNAPALAGDPVYTMGEINATAEASDGTPVGGAVLGAEDIARFNRDRLDRALETLPGVSPATTRGPRNERFVNVRGFDRFQVPLYLDGVQLYLPADNRLDLGRFLTTDLSEIQVAKGYASVLDGPGGMGGAINLVTRKPTKPLEGELRVGANLDSTGARSGYLTSASVGSRQERFYVQGSASRVQQDYFRLSEQFTPTANENGGRREGSDSRDWRVNLKAGFTPNDTDEYSVNFLKQSGSKGAPLHITDPATSNTIRYWRWPEWNVQNISVGTKTALGDKSYIKGRLFHTTFDNILQSYDDRTYSRQATTRSFTSVYDDRAYGGSVELGTDLIPRNTLKGTFHYRRDEHKEYQYLYSPRFFREPVQRSVEDTYSLAIENTFHATSAVDVVAGASYDWRNLHQAEDWDGTATGTFVHYPTKDMDAVNGQGAVIWRYSDTGRTHASVSRRTRFPTLFERFSSRFGGAVSNPGLKPERATNYEIGASEQVFGNTRVDSAVFVSDLTDTIQSVNTLFRGTAVTQSRNVGSGLDRGFELSFRTAWSPSLEFGAHYTLLVRTLDAPGTTVLKPTGTPTHKVFAFADYQPVEGLHIVPSVEAVSSVWTSNTAQTLYYRTGAHAIANLKVSYEVVKGFTAEAVVRNITDRNYQLIDGYPEEGRSFFVGARYQF
ncbi:TonB-dependent receptor plug domain-containing protein [Azospirillum sp. sgz301742]